MRSPASLVSVTLAAAFLSLGFIGCQQLFTTSLAKSLARGSISLPSNLSAGDAATLAAQAKANNDTTLAKALVSTLVAEIATTTDPGTKQSLEAAAASAAITASGLSTQLTGLLSSLTGGKRRVHRSADPDQSDRHGESQLLRRCRHRLGLSRRPSDFLERARRDRLRGRRRRTRRDSDTRQYRSLRL
jgi:hypothetical protein